MLMFSLAFSTASVRVIWTTPAFALLYATILASPITAFIEAMLTMLPLFCARICCSA